MQRRSVVKQLIGSAITFPRLVGAQEKPVKELLIFSPAGSTPDSIGRSIAAAWNSRPETPFKLIPSNKPEIFQTWFNYRPARMAYLLTGNVVRRLVRDHPFHGFKNFFNIVGSVGQLPFGFTSALRTAVTNIDELRSLRGVVTIPSLKDAAEGSASFKQLAVPLVLAKLAPNLRLRQGIDRRPNASALGDNSLDFALLNPDSISTNLRAAHLLFGRKSALYINDHPPIEEFSNNCPTDDEYTIALDPSWTDSQRREFEQALRAIASAIARESQKTLRTFSPSSLNTDELKRHYASFTLDRSFIEVSNEFVRCETDCARISSADMASLRKLQPSGALPECIVRPPVESRTRLDSAGPPLIPPDLCRYAQTDSQNNLSQSASDRPIIGRVIDVLQRMGESISGSSPSPSISESLRIEAEEFKKLDESEQNLRAQPKPAP